MPAILTIDGACQNLSAGHVFQAVKKERVSQKPTVAAARRAAEKERKPLTYIKTNIQFDYRLCLSGWSRKSDSGAIRSTRTGSVKVFSTLRARRVYEREHLPFLLTLEDFDVIHEIGYHQESGRPLTLKLLFLQNIGSIATIQRRVRRLKHLGVVQQRRSDGDKRNVELTISPDVVAIYKRLSASIKRS